MTANEAWRLVAVICLSVLLSAGWLFLTPFLQNPDENAHVDYAFALANAGLHFRVSRARFGKDVTKQVQYLEKASRFYGLRYMERSRPPTSIFSGTSNAQIDEAAPRLSHAIAKAGSIVPFAMESYPIGYYAVAALVIRALFDTVGHSIVGAFLAVRGLGICVLIATLTCAYRVFRIEGSRPLEALTIVFSIGCFPLTSWMCASIQPDVFVFGLVSFAVLLTLRMREMRRGIVAYFTLGTCLAAAMLVKQHYGVVASATCGASVFTSFIGSTRRLRWIAGCILAFTLPVLAGLFLAAHATPIGSLSLPDAVRPDTFAREHQAFVPRIFAFADHVGEGFSDAFVGGTSFHRFWNGFGWLDTPYFGRGIASIIVEASIGILSCVMSLALLAYVVRTLRRLVAVAKRRSVLVALRLFAGDVSLNLYLAWTSLLFVVFAVSDGTFSLQGRYWLPVIIPMFVVILGRVPRLFRKRSHRKMCRRAIMVCFVSYVVVAAPLGLRAASDRYYGTTTRYSYSKTVVEVDGFGVLGSRTPYRLLLADGATIELNGWAIDAYEGRPIRGIEVSIDPGASLPTRYGSPIFDAIEAENVGYRVALESCRFAIGRNWVSIRARNRNAESEAYLRAIEVDVLPVKASRPRSPCSRTPRTTGL